MRPRAGLRLCRAGAGAGSEGPMRGVRQKLQRTELRKQKRIERSWSAMRRIRHEKRSQVCVCMRCMRVVFRVLRARGFFVLRDTIGGG